MQEVTARAPEVGDEVVLELAREPSAAATARRAAQEALGRWRLPGLVDDVLLVVSELVTNAVRHGRPPVALVLRRTDRQVQVAVRDGEPAVPRARPDGQPDAEGGRGLAIVAALADRLGCTPAAGGDGKTVVASFRLRRG